MASQVLGSIEGEELFACKTEALVRLGCELDSGKVEELGIGVKVVAVERGVNSKGSARLRITSPVDDRSVSGHGCLGA